MAQTKYADIRMSRNAEAQPVIVTVHLRAFHLHLVAIKKKKKKKINYSIYKNLELEDTRTFMKYTIILPFTR